LNPHPYRFTILISGGAVGSMGDLIFEILMGFISFGSVAILFASLVGIAAWILSQLIRLDERN
jgi:hypothetical protein